MIQQESKEEAKMGKEKEEKEGIKQFTYILNFYPSPFMIQFPISYYFYL